MEMSGEHHALAALPPGKKVVPIAQEAWRAWAGQDNFEKKQSLPLSGFESRIVQPVP
jgi:hypothetical protein